MFSNGIIVLTSCRWLCMLAVGANVNNLVPFYAIGVFTGFSMAGFGMSKYHLRHKERGWRRRLVINFSAGVFTGFVVLIFAVTKFTEGAWLVVVVGPIAVFLLIRLNREYRSEDQVLEDIGDRRAAGVAPRQPNYTRRVVFVFVDSMDLATLAALRYARSLRPTSLRAVHFVIDSAKAERLRERWVRFGRGRAVRDDRHAGPRLAHASPGTGPARGRAARHPGHRGAAAAQFLPVPRPDAARPDGGQDRRGDQPDPERGRHHHPVRRGSRVRVLEERHAARTGANGTTDVDATREPPRAGAAARA